MHGLLRLDLKHSQNQNFEVSTLNSSIIDNGLHDTGGGGGSPKTEIKSWKSQIEEKRILKVGKNITFLLVVKKMNIPFQKVPPLSLTFLMVHP